MESCMNKTCLWKFAGLYICTQWLVKFVCVAARKWRAVSWEWGDFPRFWALLVGGIALGWPSQQFFLRTLHSVRGIYCWPGWKIRVSSGDRFLKPATPDWKFGVSSGARLLKPVTPGWNFGVSSGARLLEPAIPDWNFGFSDGDRFLEPTPDWNFGTAVATVFCRRRPSTAMLGLAVAETRVVCPRQHRHIPHGAIYVSG